jgi:hypothetical protein
MQRAPQAGDFVRVRSGRWLVEDGTSVAGLKVVGLACIDDDAQGESVSVLWDAELDAEVLVDEGWANDTSISCRPSAGRDSGTISRAH